MATVVLKGISKSFGKHEIIQDLDLTIPNNSLTVLVGPSGCGKSTVLRIIAGLEKASSGDVFIDGNLVNNIPPFQRGVGMVFQSYALYPHMTVYQNMRFGLLSLPLSKEEIHGRITQAAELLALTPYLDRKPKQLSGGQRQRVAMGRALVRKPKVFLFDEPLSNLDAALRTRMRLEIARIRAETKGTAVYVTHDQTEAMTLANKIVVLRAGQIEQEGTPLDVYQNPVNKFVAGFLGSPCMNFIPVQTLSESQGLLNLPGNTRVQVNSKNLHSQAQYEIGIRPEHFTIQPKSSLGLKGRLFALEPLGDQTLAHLRLDPFNENGAPTHVTARLPNDFAAELDSEIRLSFLPENCHLFEEQGKCQGRCIEA